jgi:O-antigen/teichoic acid export membrane protein
MIFVWVLFSMFLLILLFFSPFIYRFWIGEDIRIDKYLSLQMCLYTILVSWTSIFSYFLNSINVVKIQMLIAVLQATFNIPLTIFLANSMHLGVWSVMFSTNILLIASAIFLPFQYLKLINSKANGIWSK